MNEGEKGVGVVVFIILAWLAYGYYQRGQQIDQMKTVIEDCSSTIDDANQQIEDLNNNIEDAQSYAWSDYETMGDTLDGLETGETVDNNCYVPEN